VPVFPLLPPWEAAPGVQAYINGKPKTDNAKNPFAISVFTDLSILCIIVAG
jgi:hypothetical protein